MCVYLQVSYIQILYIYVSHCPTSEFERIRDIRSDMTLVMLMCIFVEETTKIYRCVLHFYRINKTISHLFKKSAIKNCSEKYISLY